MQTKAHQPDRVSRRRVGVLCRSPAGRRAAFTIMELLVVIAIIGILAALLLPALNRSMEQSRSMGCINDLKQLQLCWLMYADDNNGEVAPNNYVRTAFGTTSSAAAEQASWCPGNARTDNSTVNLETGLLWPYNQSAAIYRCPSDRSTIENAAGLKLAQPRVRSYSMNLWLNCEYWDADISRNYADVFNPTIHLLTEINQPRPSQFFVFVDTHEEAIGDPTFGLFPVGSPYPYGDRWFDMPSDRHNRGGTLSFADGHVEHWRWRAPKVFREWLSAPASADDLKDLRRMQACIPPVK